MYPIIKIDNGVARHPLYRLHEPVSLCLNDGECIAIVGDNGTGKSMLVDMLTGKHPLLINDVKYDFRPSLFVKAYDNIHHITFRDSYGTDDDTYYYQQRWNQHDIDQYPTVKDLLNDALQFSNERLESELSISDVDKERIRNQRKMFFEKIYTLFDISSLESKRIVMLSSGEQRKFQLTKALVTNPRVMIIDNPFIGLDKYSRAQLYTLLKMLYKEAGILLILVLSKTDDMPDFVTHVVEVNDLCVRPKISKSEWDANYSFPEKGQLSPEKANAILSLPYSAEFNQDFSNDNMDVIEFKDVTIRYGNRTILDHLSFKVLNGEHWAISGQNGSGKSTLLSIVFADNPQAYANNVILFGHKRGTGESIWDIKRNIGYVSPELHRSYLRDIPSIDIVASGLRDSIGLYLKPKPEQMDICRFWMDVFGIAKYGKTSFLKLSGGEQRLVLLARAFVKDPSLLILDEPLHGLDLKNRLLVKDIIKTFCKRKNKTLIMVTHYEEELPDIIDHRLTLKMVKNE